MFDMLFYPDLFYLIRNHSYFSCEKLTWDISMRS